MSNTQRVAVITGASQGIGDGLVSGSASSATQWSCQLAHYR
jgi:short-subunit dehydrogenase